MSAVKSKIQFRLPTEVVTGKTSPEDYIDKLADLMWDRFVVEYGVAEWSLVALAERAVSRNDALNQKEFWEG